MREEALHRGVFITIASARHADLSADLSQHIVVRVRRVLESLVTVNDQSSHVFRRFKGFCKRLEDKLIIVTKAHVVSHNLIIVQVLNSRHVQPGICHTVLGDIGHPFLMKCIRCKIALQHILCNSASYRGTIVTAMLTANAGTQSHFLHETQHLLMVDPHSVVLQQK